MLVPFWTLQEPQKLQNHVCTHLHRLPNSKIWSRINPCIFIFHSFQTVTQEWHDGPKIGTNHATQWHDRYGNPGFSTCMHRLWKNMCFLLLKNDLVAALHARRVFFLWKNILLRPCIPAVFFLLKITFLRLCMSAGHSFVKKYVFCLQACRRRIFFLKKCAFSQIMPLCGMIGRSSCHFSINHAIMPLLCYSL